MSKRVTTPVSLQSVYLKGFSFHVNRFEEWQNGNCTKSGSLDFDLDLISNGAGLFVKIPQSEIFRMVNSVIFPFIGSYVLQDRVQYVNAEGFTGAPNIPIVLHIFVKNSAIDCVRFAMTAPDRIVEFYGYQIEG